MKEEYLHYIFKTKQLGNQFVTTTNKKVEILDFGIHNQNSGPDFIECKIRYDHKIWAGQIEFHVKSSDWIKHKHQNDVNYNNVILHIVYEHDQEVFSGEYILPTVEIKKLVNKEKYNKFNTYLNSKNWIACQSEIQKLDEFIIYQQKESALLKRLERKSKIINDAISQYNGDRKKVFYITLFKAFGTKVNQDAFQILGEKFDYKIIPKLNFDTFKIQAYLFGLAGFLNDSMADEYFCKLQNEFKYQKKLFNLIEMNVNHWKFSTMRVFNLPTVRLAQLIELLVTDIYISNKDSIVGIKQKLEFNLTPYWKIHYMFGRQGKKENPSLTNSFKDLLFINFFIPYLFAIGQLEDNEQLKTKAFDWLDLIKSENNNIISKWKKIAIKSITAFDSQALIEQKNEFCDKNRCLQCKIGVNLLNVLRSNLSVFLFYLI